MTRKHTSLRHVGRRWLITILTMGASMNAFAGLFGFGGDSWKEEVLLHDGNKLVVNRSQTYGGKHEIGQPPPVKEHRIAFSLPGADKTITWTSEYGDDIERANFNLLALHVLNGTPYVVASPNLCLSYNKWGRPNPPYVIFRHDGRDWKRIGLDELPKEFKTINVALDILGEEVKNLVKMGLVPADKIKQLNAHTTITEFMTILREQIKHRAIGSLVNCEELVRYKCGWISPNSAFGRDFLDRTCK